MKEYVPDFSYAELSQIKELAQRQLAEVLSDRGGNINKFYPDFVEKVEEYKKTGVGISISPIIPDEIYILATIIYRVDEIDGLIKQELKRIRR